METERASLTDPVVREALLRCRFAMRSLLGEEEFFDSAYWQDDEPDVSYDGHSLVFGWPGGRTLSYLVGRDEVLETVEESGPWLTCRAVSRTGKLLRCWRHALGDAALN